MRTLARRERFRCSLSYFTQAFDDMVLLQHQKNNILQLCVGMEVACRPRLKAFDDFVPAYFHVGFKMVLFFLQEPPQTTPVIYNSFRLSTCRLDCLVGQTLLSLTARWL